MCIQATRWWIPPLIGTSAVDGVHQTQRTVWVRYILEPYYENLDKSPLFLDVLIGWMIVLGLKLCELPS